ncbi:MAG: hypothetical protein ACI9NT_002589 [Bacteroidia bacterium]|jgi:hypothetical protein
MGALVWVAMDQFNVSREEVLELALTAAVTVGIAIGGAALVTAIWLLLKHLVKRFSRARRAEKSGEGQD